MQLAFDLISDLHIETWDKFNWSDQPTSTVCIVAGDVSRDRTQLIETLEHLGRVYQAVFYIDGNAEHEDYLNNLDGSYANLIEEIKDIPNVIYMLDNVVVIDGVAILATNGWWTYNFDSDIDAEQSMQYYQAKQDITLYQSKKIARMSNSEVDYLVRSIQRLQSYIDVKKIVVVTHTVPNPQLIAHDVDLEHTHEFNCMGNQHMMQVLSADLEKKIHTWCFGHYHNDVDQIRNGVRFVNNCRGKMDSKYRNYVYCPKRIVIDF